MRIETARLDQRGVETEVAVLGESRPPKLQPARHHLDMALAQRIVDHILVLLHLQDQDLITNVAPE